MEESRLIFDVTDATFVDEVLKASHDVPVAVDFWAPWCEPCRALSPALERVIESMGGAVKLAKLDIDRSPTVAQRLGFSGVPTVKLFRNGEVISEFVGLIPEADIKLFLERGLPSPEELLVDEAVALISAGAVEAAKGKLEEVVKLSPSHPRAHLELGKLALRSGDFDGAEREFGEVSEGTAEFEAAATHLAATEFNKSCHQRGGLEKTEDKYKQSPGSLDAKFDFAQCLAAGEEYEEALRLLLEIVGAEKGYREGAAKEDMVKIFGVLGQRSPLAREYRSKLASALY